MEERPQEERCSDCGARGETKLLRCSKCRRAKYCSKECQVRHWKQNGHAFLCSSKVEVRACEGKGMGVFALKDIAVGEEIHREKPLFYGSIDETDLSPSMRKLVWAFHDAHNGDDKKTLGGITKTNTLPGDDKHGMFLLACRMNHACNGAQNARYVWRTDLGKMMVRAIRPIAEGDEVVVNYIVSYLPRAERQKRLWDGFRFRCSCAECTTKWSAERDGALEWLRHSIDDDYIQVAERQPVSALGMVEDVLETLAELDLNTPLDRGSIHYDGVQIAGRASNVVKMRYHLKKAHECWIQTEGEGSPQDLMGRQMMASRIVPAPGTV